jgi:hypothetical protein
MGGFILHERGKAVQILEARDLEELSEAGKIDWPTITEEEIADRSKGDYLSKTIVLFQTTWFIGQCIARGAYGLDVTELEVVTLAFATLTGVIYYLWWDKPLDVRCSIPVHLIEDRSEKIGVDVEVEKHDPASQSPVLLNPTQLIDGHSENPRDDLEKQGAGSQICSSPQIPDKESSERKEEISTFPNPLPSTQAQGNNPIPDPALTGMQRLQAFRRRACMKHGTLLGLGYVFIIFPMIRFFGAFVDMISSDTLGDNTLRVPTFYSPTDEDEGIAALLGLCVSVVFGAIHCIAWSFHFTTLQERWTWRISAILVSGFPVVIATFSVFLTAFEKEENRTMWIELYENFLSTILMTMTCLYIIARVALLLLPFVALRALSPDAYVELNWVSFLPHI